MAIAECGGFAHSRIGFRRHSETLSRAESKRPDHSQQWQFLQGFPQCDGYRQAAKFLAADGFGGRSLNGQLLI
jgi:hypothetical protein